jgi:hypothetical protein
VLTVLDLIPATGNYSITSSDTGVSSLVFYAIFGAYVLFFASGVKPEFAIPSRSYNFILARFRPTVNLLLIVGS